MNSFDDLTNDNKYDPLAEINDSLNSSKIHIRIQKRNARKCICTVEGLTYEKKEMKELLKTMKKKFACNGNLVDDAKLGTIIQMQGDVRDKIKEILVNNYGIDENTIITHGYD